MRTRLVLGAAAVASLVYGTVLAADVGAFDDVPAVTEVNLLATAALMFVGLVVWHRRPDNRVGVLMTALGFNLQLLFLVYSRHDALWTAGMVLQGSHMGLTAHLLLAYPIGRLGSRDRALVAIAYCGLFAANLVRLLTWDPQRPGLWNADGAFALPDNLLLVVDAPGVTEVAEAVSRALHFGVLTALGVMLVWRWARSAPRQRRLSAAVILPGAAWAFRMAANAPLEQWGRSLLIDDGQFTWLYYALALSGFGLLLAVALGVLYVGLLRQGRARSVEAELVLDLEAPAGVGRLRKTHRRSVREHPRPRSDPSESPDSVGTAHRMDRVDGPTARGGPR